MTFDLPSTLPVEAVVPEVRAALSERRRAVLIAPPGTGKTTVVPLRLLEGQRDLGIVVLEPRRLAARAAARRMATLLGESVGRTVGYVTRQDRNVGPETRIKVVTEGILTRWIQRDPTLPGVDVVVFDEFHERNLQTDLGLALLLDVTETVRPDLAILVMSATLQGQSVAALLGGAGGPVPVVEAVGERHPVDVVWAPAPPRGRLEHHTAQTVKAAMAQHPGDALVFLPGMAEIRRTADVLDVGDVAVRILHGSLAPDEQDRAMRPEVDGRRRVILSTDIAESSVTVEGVSIVVDSGLARSPRYDPRTGMTRLVTVPISKASAEQRSGRAGRLGPGVAVRLWSKMEHAGRPTQIQPEILTVDLAGMLLELAEWGTTDPSTMSFLDQPPKRLVDEAHRLLVDLGALDADGAITGLGRGMGRLPLHPRLGRMVLASGADAALACIVAALLEDRDVLRGRPDDLPADLVERVRLVLDRGRHHPNAAGGAVARARDAAEDLARRADIPPLPINTDRTGAVLALAYPDRLALRRGGPGRFQLRTGTTAWMAPGDGLAGERFLIAADLDGKRKDARIRLAAPLDAEDVAAEFGEHVVTRTRVEWDDDRLVQRTERRIGGIALSEETRRPEPGAETSKALATYLRRHGVGRLSWSAAAVSLRGRVEFARSRQEGTWPDWSTKGLAADLDSWLGPELATASGLDDLQRVDLSKVLRRRLGYELLASLDRSVPAHLTIAGRQIPIDYDAAAPTVAVRIQSVFGMASSPEVLGTPIVFDLRSPADRTIQITADLAGFWSGSWHDVRRDMAGRYPKHSWPERPYEM